MPQIINKQELKWTSKGVSLREHEGNGWLLSSCDTELACVQRLSSSVAGDGEVLWGTGPGLYSWGASGDGGHLRTRFLWMAGVWSPVPPLQPRHTPRGRALAESQVQDMSNEKFTFGGSLGGLEDQAGAHASR